MNSNALKAQLALRGKNVNQLIDELSDKFSLKMSRSAFYRKLNGTSEFNGKEISAIADLLNLNNDTLLDVFFSRKVS